MIRCEDEDFCKRMRFLYAHSDVVSSRKDLSTKDDCASIHDLVDHRDDLTKERSRYLHHDYLLQGIQPSTELYDIDASFNFHLRSVSSAFKLLAAACASSAFP